MEESKYYTPETEEFHVGFEYEKFLFFGEKEWWESKVFSEPLMYGTSISSEIKRNAIRVKHLDREDIESLGWKFFSDCSGTSWFELSDKWDLGIDEDNYVTIRMGQEMVFFSGTIKNKSELKRVLKQIGI